MYRFYIIIRVAVCELLRYCQVKAASLTMVFSKDAIGSHAVNSIAMWMFRDLGQFFQKPAVFEKNIIRFNVRLIYFCSII